MRTQEGRFGFRDQQLIRDDAGRNNQSIFPETAAGVLLMSVLEAIIHLKLNCSFIDFKRHKRRGAEIENGIQSLI